MRDVQGYEILHNGVPRTFVTDARRQAAQFAKSRAKGDIIEVRDCIEVCDCATGEKLVMLADGRVG